MLPTKQPTGYGTLQEESLVISRKSINRLENSIHCQLIDFLEFYLRNSILWEW